MISLLVLMYHRAVPGRHGNAPAMLEAHLALVAREQHVVLPGEPLERGRLNVCLTFDDAYYDFYAVVFPLLRRHGLRALLAVVPTWVRERVAAPAEERLALGAEAAAARPDAGGFCTWPELDEMGRSGCVTIAAHGLTHQPLDRPGVDLAAEVATPGELLRARLGQAVDSFVLPYGRCNRRLLRFARDHYRHVFRIGAASNRGWTAPVLYRVDADALATPAAPFAAHRLRACRWRFFWNRLRGR